MKFLSKLLTIIFVSLLGSSLHAYDLEHKRAIIQLQADAYQAMINQNAYTPYDLGIRAHMLVGLNSSQFAMINQAIAAHEAALALVSDDRMTELNKTYRNLENVVKDIIAESFGGSRKRLRVPTVVVSRAHRSVQAVQSGTWLGDNGFDAVMGLIALYGLMAYYNQWTPFDGQEPAENTPTQNTHNQVPQAAQNSTSIAP